ncbi:MAG: hypothetical protein NTY20_04645 [Candidatus Aenigmarchaeota archaeon]|nr:hypothetical protein [Candidatus Aenigmarchaeota archaeon]
MNSKFHIFICLSLFLFSLLVLASPAKAQYGPRAYVTEYVTQDYWWNGSTKGTDVRRGYVEASIPNNWDVLQYLRINLTGGVTSTDLQNQAGGSMAYANTLTSYSTSNSEATVYVNTSSYQQATYYNITTANVAPTINLTLTVNNTAGGTDIYDSDNIGTGGSTNTLRLNLTIRNSGSVDNLTGVTVVLQFNITSGATRDMINITVGTNVTTGPGTNYVTNTDGGDNDFDRLTWTGYLAPSALVYIVFNATLLEGSGGNIVDGTNFANLDAPGEKGGLGNYSNSTQTHTGMTINYNFTRGPIRQGVDLQISNGVWYVRGLIKNQANGSLSAGNQSLTYNITEWRIYMVNASSGAPYGGSANLTGKFNQSATSSLLTPSNGMIYTTDSSRSSNTTWFNTTSGTKPYIAIYFDWYVLWNASNALNYASNINTTMDMQTLYKVDLIPEKSLTGVIYPDTGGQSVTVQENATYNGNNSIGVGNIVINSIIPANTTTGAMHGLFNISNSTIKVYYVNGTAPYTYQLNTNANVNWTSINPMTTGKNGTVKLTILDLSSATVVGGGAVGKNLTATGTEEIVLQYDVISNVSMTTGDIYNFTGNTTFTTTSGTADAEAHTAQSISVSAQRLMGYKDLFVPNPANPTLVNETLFVTVESQGSNSISGIKFIDYVVNGTFNNNATAYGKAVNVTFFNQVITVGWTYLNQYNVTFNGTRQLTDGTWAEVFEFVNMTGAGGGFILNNTQNITVNYQMDIGTSGTYILPLQIAAFDPDTGQTYITESWGIVRVDIPSAAVPLQITDHNLELAKRVVVGTPAMWIKNFEVYNPNSRIISSNFETTVFGDSMQGFVSFYNERGENVEEKISFGNVENGKKSMSWSSALNPFETRTYEVRILTPPVMEIDRDIEVLDKLENKMVKLKMDIFLKSFSEEKYLNLVLNLPLSYENIIEVKDGFGRSMQFTGGKDTSSIIVDEIEPSGMKTIRAA